MNIVYVHLAVSFVVHMSDYFLNLDVFGSREHKHISYPNIIAAASNVLI